MLGSNAGAQIVGCTAADWRHDPWALGSYAIARPGVGAARAACATLLRAGPLRRRRRGDRRLARHGGRRLPQRPGRRACHPGRAGLSQPCHHVVLRCAGRSRSAGCIRAAKHEGDIVMIRITRWLRHGRLHLATALGLLAASSTAQAADLTVYTALEADQLKAYKAAFEKANPGHQRSTGSAIRPASSPPSCWPRRPIRRPTW